MKNLKEATFGGGCFWCVEAIIKLLKGVEYVEPGYTGGTAPGKPTYKEVCSGLTGHAEVIRVHFDPELISYHQLLSVFMTSHDPTTLNRQGGDTGTQYRSVIFYHDEAQKASAEQVLEEVQPLFDRPVVTQIEKLGPYYTAEDYHHDYYNNNENQGYCSAVISPKIAKFKSQFASLLK